MIELLIVIVDYSDNMTSNCSLLQVVCIRSPPCNIKDITYFLSSTLFIYQVQELEEQLREKTDTYSQMVLKKEQLDRDLEALQASGEELRDTVRQLETELESRTAETRSLRQVSISSRQGAFTQFWLSPFSDNHNYYLLLMFFYK